MSGATALQVLLMLTKDEHLCSKETGKNSITRITVENNISDNGNIPMTHELSDLLFGPQIPDHCRSVDICQLIPHTTLSIWVNLPDSFTNSTHQS